MNSNQRSNQLLSKVNFVTSIGDFISLFTVIQLTSGLNNITIASLAISVKALGAAIGGLTFPKVSSHFSLKNILIKSQIFSGISMACLTAFAVTDSAPVFIFTSLLFQSILKQYFDGARETYSKIVGRDQDHRSMQAELLSGFYSAQMIGPIISFILVKYSPPWLPLLLDTLSFFIASFFLRSLADLRTGLSHSILRPFSYLFRYKDLAHIFLLRSLGFWIPAGIYNYVMFSVIESVYNKSSYYTAILYVALGTGGTVATILLKGPVSINLTKNLKIGLSKVGDAKAAAIALSLITTTRLVFAESSVFLIAVIATIFQGFFSGINAVTTQSLRRKLTNDQQFPEIVALEVVVGRMVEGMMGYLCFMIFSKELLQPNQGIWVSAALSLVLAGLHLIGNLKKF